MTIAPLDPAFMQRGSAKASAGKRGVTSFRPEVMPAGGAREARSRAKSHGHRYCQPITNYTPQGVLVRWRHCWWDENGFFVQPAGVHLTGRRGLRAGKGSYKITTNAPTAVMRELSKADRGRIYKARSRYYKAVKQALSGIVSIPSAQEGEL